MNLMQLLPGNIELSQNPFEKVIWNLLRKLLQQDDGILGYKIPSLGMKDSMDIPSFILRSKKYGIIVIDVVPSKIIKFEDEFEYWLQPDGEEIYSRDYITSNYCKDINNKLSKSIKLYSNRTSSFKFCQEKKNPINSLVIFPDNITADLDKNNFFNEILDNSYSH